MWWTSAAAHSPYTHATPASHGLVQPPQCASSLLGSTHTESHASSSSSQVVTHCPAVHAASPTHGWSHPPQCIGSTSVSTQAPAHCVCAPQSSTQLPASHTSPAAHALSQPPHAAGSLCVSTHTPSQSISPGAQCPAVSSSSSSSSGSPVASEGPPLVGSVSVPAAAPGSEHAVANRIPSTEHDANRTARWYRVSPGGRSRRRPGPAAPPRPSPRAPRRRPSAPRFPP